MVIGHSQGGITAWSVAEMQATLRDPDYLGAISVSGAADPKSILDQMGEPGSSAGLQLYSGNQLDGSVAGRGGAYRQSAGIAFEPQGFPHAPHHRSFPTTVLRPGENYRQCIAYRFGIAP